MKPNETKMDKKEYDDEEEEEKMRAIAYQYIRRSLAPSV